MPTTPASRDPSPGRASVPGALASTSGARARVSAANAPSSQAGSRVYGRPTTPPPDRPGRTPGNGGEYSGRKKIRPRWGRIALVAGCAVLLLALLAGIGG